MTNDQSQNVFSLLGTCASDQWPATNGQRTNSPQTEFARLNIAHWAFGIPWALEIGHWSLQWASPHGSGYEKEKVGWFSIWRGSWGFREIKRGLKAAAALAVSAAACA